MIWVMTLFIELRIGREGKGVWGKVREEVVVEVINFILEFVLLVWKSSR